jgi:hypothetical protein
VSVVALVGNAGATYSQFTIVHGTAAATVDVYGEADNNTGTPSCTVTATITPTSQ